MKHIKNINLSNNWNEKSILSNVDVKNISSDYIKSFIINKIHYKNYKILPKANLKISRYNT